MNEKQIVHVIDLLLKLIYRLYYAKTYDHFDGDISGVVHCVQCNNLFYVISTYQQPAHQRCPKCDKYWYITNDGHNFMLSEPFIPEPKHYTVWPVQTDIYSTINQETGEQTYP
jgi:hypothetical protein